MMKFQGRQTVRNMLVMTLLIAGAYFASFYAPMLNTSSTYSFSTRPVDFEYHWRNDQNWPERGEVESLASKHGVDITSWTQVDAATLGCDGTVSIEQSAELWAPPTPRNTGRSKAGPPIFPRAPGTPSPAKLWTWPPHLCQCAG